MPFAVIGHRGTPAVVPENTLTSFRRAEADGADAIELDVRSTRDGTTIVMHDPDISRTTTGHGAVADLEAASLRGIAGADGLPPPTLAAALDSVTVPVQVEIKDPRSAPTVVDEIRRRPDRERFTLSSFDSAVLRKIKESFPQGRLGLISDRLDDAVIATAVGLGAGAVYAGIQATSRTAVTAAQDAGIQVYVWLVNDAVSLERAIALGVAGVTSDNPGAIVRMLGRG
ncbi:glycerophosphodiester phosphodiesterase [Mycobacterium sp. NPDC003449]